MKRLFLIGLLLVGCFSFVSAGDNLILNSSLSVPKCASVTSATLDVTGSDVSQLLYTNRDGSSSFKILKYLAPNNYSGGGQSKIIYNRQISSIGFYVLGERW